MMPSVSALPTRPRGVPAMASRAASKRPKALLRSVSPRALPPLPARRHSVVGVRGLMPPLPAMQRTATAAPAAVARWAAQQATWLQSVAGVALCMLAARVAADQIQRAQPGVQTLRTLDIASGVGAALGALALGHRALVAHGAPPWAPSAALWGTLFTVGMWDQEAPRVLVGVVSMALTALTTGASCLGLTALNLLVRQGMPAPIAVALWVALPAGWAGYQIGR